QHEHPARHRRPGNLLRQPQPERGDRPGTGAGPLHLCPSAVQPGRHRRPRPRRRAARRPPQLFLRRLLGQRLPRRRRGQRVARGRGVWRIAMSGAIVHSALYHGWVQHRRFAPRAHAFHYRMGLLYLDLAEQDAVLGLSALSGRGRFAAFAFRETDYLPEFTRQGMSLADAVRQRVSEALGRTISGPVRLLTQPRSWGLSFNPVSFFYCFDEQERLAAILCEVSNTPWRERYHYVLPA